MFTRKAFLWLVVLGGLLIALAACAAPMDASKARSRSVIESGGIVPAEELRVAEYLNYYTQSFPEPTQDDPGPRPAPGQPADPDGAAAKRGSRSASRPSRRSRSTSRR